MNRTAEDLIYHHRGNLLGLGQVFDGSLNGTSENEDTITAEEFCQGEFCNSIIKNIIFQSCDFTQADFKYAFLENVHFEDCELEESSFESAQLDCVYFENCRMEAAIFDVCEANNLCVLSCSGRVSFGAADLEKGSYFYDCNFRESDFSGTQFHEGYYLECDFSGSKFTDNTLLDNPIFQSCDLTDTKAYRSKKTTAACFSDCMVAPFNGVDKTILSRGHQRVPFPMGPRKGENVKASFSMLREDGTRVYGPKPSGKFGGWSPGQGRHYNGYGYEPRPRQAHLICSDLDEFRGVQ